MHPPAPLSPRNYYKYSPGSPQEASTPFHTRRTCSPFSYGIHPNSPVLQKRKMLAESSYITEGIGKRPPDEKDYRSLEPEYDYSPSNWLEWKKHILAQKQNEEDRNSLKRKNEGRLLDELKYSLDTDSGSSGRPVVTVIKKDETMSRKAQPVLHAAHTMPCVQRAAVSAQSPTATPRPALKRQASLPTRTSHPRQEDGLEREEEFVRPTTPTRVIVPEIVRQMNEISENQKKELERSESLRNRTRARSPPPFRRSQSRSPVNSLRSSSPGRTNYTRRSVSPHAIATLHAVNESLLKTAEHLSASNEKLHRLTPERISPPKLIVPTASEPPNMPSSISSAHWYRPNMTREAAIDSLKNKPPGSFIIRDSTSYPGGYGLAMKVPDRGEHKTPEECVRHFLIEPATGGVRVRGSDIEPIFSSLNALIYQHSLTPLSLPHRLLLTDASVEPKSAEKLLQSLVGIVPDYGKGVAFMVIYLGFHEIGMLTGPHAVKNGFDNLFARRSDKTIQTGVVVMKISGDGITLTDHEHRLFFRIHFPRKNLRYCDMDPGHRHWEFRDEVSGDTRAPSCFGIVCASATDPLLNECHMFGEFEQPASLLVEEINRWSEKFF